MNKGWLYCFSNEGMPGMLKIGMTKRTPKIRLNEANSHDTWRSPLPYKIEIAKEVYDPKQKETILHHQLKENRVSPKSEFFRISLEEVKPYFSLMDGKLWVKKDTEEDEKKDGKCRDARQCFRNGQRIRHIINDNRIWIGIYDSTNNAIKHNGKMYIGRSPLNQFVKAHYETERKDRTSNANAWSECECEVNGEWISTFNMK